MKTTIPWYHLDIKLIEQAFTQATKTYDQHAIMQKRVGELLRQRLDLLRDEPKIILNVGSATGYFAQALAQKYTASEIIQLDITEAMLAYAKNKYNTYKNFQFINADTIALPFPDNSVDMIISNLMLHWSNDPQAVLQQWQRVLKPKGVLFFTTLGYDTLQELKQAADADDNMPHIHRFFDMHNIGDMLLQAKFADPVMDVQHIKIHYDSVKALLKDLKLTGCHNISSGRRKSLTGKHRLQNIEKKYQTENKKIFASYEVIFGHAWGSDITDMTKRDAHGDVSISITNLRQLIRTRFT